MELSLFRAKLFGVYLLIVGALCAVRGEMISKVIEEFFASRPMLFLSGLLALAVGIAMAISHSIWELNWRGLITLVGYLSLLIRGGLIPNEEGATYILSFCARPPSGRSGKA